MYKHDVLFTETEKKSERQRETFSTGNQTIRVEAISFPNSPFVLISVSNWSTHTDTCKNTSKPHIFATDTKTRPNLFAENNTQLRAIARSRVHAQQKHSPMLKGYTEGLVFASHILCGLKIFHRCLSK